MVWFLAGRARAVVECAPDGARLRNGSPCPAMRGGSRSRNQPGHGRCRDGFSRRRTCCLWARWRRSAPRIFFVFWCAWSSPALACGHQKTKKLKSTRARGTTAAAMFLRGCRRALYPARATLSEPLTWVRPSAWPAARMLSKIDLPRGRLLFFLARRALLWRSPGGRSVVLVFRCFGGARLGESCVARADRMMA